MGGCFAALSIKLFHRHPTKDKPLVDYDILLLIISPVLIGTSIGVIVNIILPYWTIILLLAIIIDVLSIGMIKTSIKKFKQETV